MGQGMTKVEKPNAATSSPLLYSAINATKRVCGVKKGYLALHKKRIYLIALSWLKADLERQAIGNFNPSISALLDCVIYLHEHMQEVNQ